MKKGFQFVFPVVALLFSGCLQHSVVISLNKDGSGTITEETTLSGQAVQMMEQMAGLGGQPGAAPSPNPLIALADKEAAERRAGEMGEGVKLVGVEVVDAAGRRGGRAVFAFQDINTLKYRFGAAVEEAGEAMPKDGGELDREETPPLEFRYADGVLAMKNDPAGKKGGEKPPAREMDEQGLMMAKQMMGDMTMSFRIEFPGGIAKTNASHVEGNTVTLMDMQMAKLLEDPERFKKFQAADPQTPAEMKEALKGVEGVKVETAEELTVELK